MGAVQWGEIDSMAVLDQPIFNRSEEECTSQVFHLSPRILLCRISGNFLASHAKGIAAASTDCMGNTPELHYFCDWDLMQSYESEARSTMTNWGREQRHVLKTGTFLCGSRLVEMGVTVAGAAMAILGIEIRAVNRNTLNARLRSALEKWPPVRQGEPSGKKSVLLPLL